MSFFNEPEISDSGLKSLPEDLCSGFLSHEKNPSTSAGFEPANLGSRASTLPRDLMEDTYVLLINCRFHLFRSSAFSISSQLSVSQIIKELCSSSSYSFQFRHLSFNDERPTGKKNTTIEWDNIRSFCPAMTSLSRYLEDLKVLINGEVL